MCCKSTEWYRWPTRKTSKLPGQPHNGSITAATEAHNNCSSYKEVDRFKCGQSLVG